MREEVLHYLWQHQAFDYSHLQTIQGEPIQVYSVGIQTNHAGPDFAMSRLRIGSLEWCGSVEVHVRASDWNHHRHQEDSAYDRVILHVVWQYDQEIYRQDGTPVPTLELKNRVELSLLLKIEAFFGRQSGFIPCEAQAETVENVIKISQVERAATLRMERKAQLVSVLLEQNHGDWEECAYQWLLKAFGFEVNSESMLRLAQVFPWRWVKRCYANRDQLSDIFLWQAGLAHNTGARDSSTFQYFSEGKHKRLKAASWRYSRLRPANFPHIRITQVANLLTQWKTDLSWIYQPLAREDLLEKFRLGNQQESVSPPLGKKSIEHLLINGVVPLLTAYGLYYRDDRNMQHAWSLLENLPPEENRIVRKFKERSFSNASALHTQGMLEQYYTFCEKKNCLKCSIGSAIMKKHRLFVSSSNES